MRIAFALHEERYRSVMKCVEVQALLSAYLDQEAPADKQGAITRHLNECEACSRQLREFKTLSVLTTTLSHPLPPKHAWQTLESALAQSKENSRPVELEVVGSRPKISRGACFAVMLTIAVALVSGWIAIRQWAHHNDENLMAAVFERYLDVFSRDPIAAQNILLTSFVGQKLPEGQAASLVGYRPLIIAKGLPKGYSIDETFAIKMPCCVCVYCRCQRFDGTSIAILEHNDAEPSWFAGKKKVEANCGGTSCELVILSDRVAATWKHENRYITVIGGQNTTEIDRLVGWFDNSK
jgi:hypothetical protein